MTVLERTIQDAAVSADDLGWFRGYLRGILDSGSISREELEIVLEHVCIELRNRGDEVTADLVLDGLDLLVGWSGPAVEV